MRNNIIVIIVSVVLSLGGFTLLFNGGNSFGASTDTNILNSWTFKKDVTILDSNASATTTLQAGGIEAYATSTATKVCQRYIPVATTTSTYQASANGFVVWTYGSCP